MLVSTFLAFAFAYFLSAILRAVTATLAPVFGAELGITAADLGLLAGAFFLGFSLMQLPLGHALDRFGPRPVLIALIAVAALACVGFSQSHGLWALVVSRALIGVGVSACLMAPLTFFRGFYAEQQQLRANSWMLMTGSLGMLASTLPVQWLLPLWGWRGLFGALAALLLFSALVIRAVVPDLGERDRVDVPMQGQGYRAVLTHPLFVRLCPMGFFVYGGMIATQALWAGPWFTQVAGLTPAQAAEGLFVVNGCMLLAFMSWGALAPFLSARGFDGQRLIRLGVPLSLVVLAVNIIRGSDAGPWSWAAWCVACTFVTPSQPTIGQAFARHMTGRALSAFNLVIFTGVFSLQWGIGLLVDALRRSGWSELDAFRQAFGALWVCCVLSYFWYLWLGRRAAQ